MLFSPAEFVFTFKLVGHFFHQLRMMDAGVEVRVLFRKIADSRQKNCRYRICNLIINNGQCYNEIGDIRISTARIAIMSVL